MEIWSAVAAEVGAEMVAGELIAFTDGKHVSYGKKVGASFTFTPEGQALNERLTSEAIVAVAKAEARAPRLSKAEQKAAKEAKDAEEAEAAAAKAAEEAAAAEQAAADAAAAADNDPDETDLDKELSLLLNDTVDLEDSAG